MSFVIRITYQVLQQDNHLLSSFLKLVLLTIGLDTKELVGWSVSGPLHPTSSLVSDDLPCFLASCEIPRFPGRTQDFPRSSATPSIPCAHPWEAPINNTIPSHPHIIPHQLPTCFQVQQYQHPIPVDLRSLEAQVPPFSLGSQSPCPIM